VTAAVFCWLLVVAPPARAQNELPPPPPVDSALPPPTAKLPAAAPTKEIPALGEAHAAAEAPEANGEEEQSFNVHLSGWLTPIIGHVLERSIHDEHQLHEALPTYEAAATSILIVLLLGLGAFLSTRRLRRLPSRGQAMLELIVQGLNDFTMELIGPHGKRFVPLISTLFLYILTMNLMGLVPGMKSPTANINITAGMALVAVGYAQYQGIRSNGLIGYFMHFVGEPWWLFWLNVPIHIIGELAKVLSLAVRLFGNIFGEDMVIVILVVLSVMFLPIYLPLPMQFPMDLLAVFTSIVQAGVFTILTCVYIALLTEHEAEHFASAGHGGQAALEGAAA